MTSAEYRKLLEESLDRLGEIALERDALEQEASKQRQFIQATVRMLDDVDRDSFLKWYRDTIAAQKVKSEGLTDVIRDILQENPKEWFSAAAMRDKLVAEGFDFTAYASNPLASVSTTLARLHPKETDYSKSEGVAAYRWKNTKANRLRAKKRHETAMEAFYGTTLNGLLGDEDAGEE